MRGRVWGGLSTQRAVERIRAARQVGDTAAWTVRVKGHNTIREPLSFTAEDHDIVFEGEKGAVISGGARIDGWNDIGKGWWEAPAPLKADGGVVYFEQLWTNGKIFASNANLMFGGEDLTPPLLAACFRVYACGKGHLLQPNSCDVDTLLDAQKHPERHLDLMVKVCGFSARFITLSKRFQDEVIARHRLK